MAVSLEDRDTELRRRLVIENKTISGHCDRVAGLSQEFRHTIRCVDRPTEGTCVTHALELLGRFRPLVAQLQEAEVKPGRAFVEWLLRNEKQLVTPKPDSLALYFDGETWKHAAVVLPDGRVRSEWGSYAVFEHRLSEVPADYGNAVRFFRRPCAEEAACLLFEFGCRELQLSPREVQLLRARTGVPASR